MPKLYLDDIVALENIIVNELGATDYSITCNGYVCDTIKEVPTKPRTSNNLEIQSNNPSILLNFYTNGASLSISSDGIKARGAVNSMEDNVLLRTQRKWLYVVYWVLALLGAPAIIIPAFCSAYYKSVLLGLLALLVGIFYVYFCYFYVTSNFSKIILCNRDDTSGFLSRNKDQIILILIGALAGALVTYAINYLVNG